MNEAMVPPSDPFPLRSFAIAPDSSHVPETQDGFIPMRLLFSGIRAVVGSTEERVAMADAPLRKVEVREKAISAAGAAFIAAVIVNPLDVAKTRLQAQEAGVSYQQACAMEGSGLIKASVDGRCPPACPRTTMAGVSLDCPPTSERYKGTFDVMRRVVQEEDFLRLWRGLNASLAISIPTAQMDPRTGKLPGVFAVLRSVNNMYGVHGGQLQGIRVMWTGVGAQLARDVPFSAICWSVLEPLLRSLRQRCSERAKKSGRLDLRCLRGSATLFGVVCAERLVNPSTKVNRSTECTLSAMKSTTAKDTSKLNTEFLEVSESSVQFFPSPQEATALQSKDANSTSTPTSQYYSARIDWMMQNRGRYATQVEFVVACSKSHWSTVERPGGSRSEKEPESQQGVRSACSSGDDKEDERKLDEEVLKANREFYKQQTQHKVWGWLFQEDDDRLYKIGEKIAQGGEAHIYAGFRTDPGEDDRGRHVVFKVFPRGVKLQDLVTLWPEPVFEQNRLGTSLWWRTMIEHVMLFPGDGRIAMVMERAWGDLRRCIDMKKQANHNQGPPLDLETALGLMCRIAFQMKRLHQGNVVHRDLKASNVLLQFRDPLTAESSLMADVELNVQPILDGLYIRVSDYECALGVLGTGFWRAPEVLLAMKDPQKRNSLGLFTEKSDVYSYGMVCYEIVTGFLPFEREGFVGAGTREDRGRVINGLRPSFPDGVDGRVKELITRCWHQDEVQRPTFAEAALSFQGLR